MYIFTSLVFLLASDTIIRLMQVPKCILSTRKTNWPITAPVIRCQLIVSGRSCLDTRVIIVDAPCLGLSRRTGILSYREYQNHNSSEWQRYKYCRTLFRRMTNAGAGSELGSFLYKQLEPILFGKIPYSPATAKVKETIRRANDTFKVSHSNYHALSWKLMLEYKKLIASLLKSGSLTNKDLK